MSAISDLVATPPKNSKTTYTFLSRDQVFTFKINGLMPFTYHHFYVNQTPVDGKVKPSAGKLGDALLTDRDGKLMFDYFFSEMNLDTTTGHSLEEANKKVADVSAVKEFVLTNISSTSLPTDYKDSSLSWWVGHATIQVAWPAQDADWLNNYSAQQAAAAADPRFQAPVADSSSGYSQYGAGF